MCGISGIFSEASRSAPIGDVLHRMIAAISHRGPDAAGIWEDTSCGLGLGHSRLSIVDLSPAGHQPMRSICDRYVIVFNGEIYNHQALREKLEAGSAEAITWRGHSDTETLLQAISRWGLEQALKAAIGMFAFALWDRHHQTLTFARDRFGEKPLYYGWVDGGLAFASELKALQVVPGWKSEVEPAVLEDYLRFGCVGGQKSIFKDLFKLPPGSTLTVSRSDIRNSVLPDPRTWWSAIDAASSAKRNQPKLTEEQALTSVERSLNSSVGRQMVADVPLGAFLSGGIDSSLIVALMQAQSTRQVKTFSVGFDDPRYDESGHAEAVAAHLGTDHTSLRATSQMALDLIPRLPALYDEPFADSSQLPTCLISRLTKEHVTVALSGDAGDELFGGYNRHVWVPRVWAKLSRMPLPMRRTLSRTLKLGSAATYDRMMALGSQVLPSRYHIRTFGEKLHKLADVLACSSEKELYGGLASMNRHPEQLLRSEYRSGRSVGDLYPVLAGFNQLEWMMLMDTLTFMTDDVLVKVDRASMASSLEVRAPFLDPDVYAAAWQLPPDMRVRNGVGKWALRQVLYRYVPRELIDRPKMGFAIPLDEWLRGPLREWAEDLLSAQSVGSIPQLDPVAIRRMWEQHLAGRGHFAQQLWCVLQLISWFRSWGSR